jgi:chemotaxis protein CheX
MPKPTAECTIPTDADLELGLACALSDVFSAMFNAQARIVPAAEIDNLQFMTAMLGFAGRLSGFLCLHVNQDVACSLASGLLGMQLDHVDDTVCDAMGEISNMLAGGLKTHLSHNGEAFKLAIPSVIQGREYSTRAPAHAKNLIMGVAAGPHRFKLQLVLEQP